jgi:outer membrane protein TolC
MLQRADESARIALAAYREGGADLLRLLDAQRVRIELETLYYRTLSEYRQSIVALETAMGVNP